MVNKTYHEVPKDILPARIAGIGVEIDRAEQTLDFRLEAK